MGAFTTMTSKGRLTIPKEVREALNLPAGTKVRVSAVSGRVVAVPKNRSVADVAGLFDKPPSGRVSGSDDIRLGLGEHLARDDEAIRRAWRGREAPGSMDEAG